MRLALALIVTLLATFPALANPGCMTMREARAEHHTSHLFWHGNGHCWDATPVHSASRTRHAKESAPVQRAPQHAERMPSSDAAGIGAVSIWPAPPSDFTWADRWPNQDRISPDRWLMELVQFGSQR
jgi:hypothetical protein